MLGRTSVPLKKTTITLRQLRIDCSIMSHLIIMPRMLRIIPVLVGRDQIVQSIRFLRVLIVVLSSRSSLL